MTDKPTTTNTAAREYEVRKGSNDEWGIYLRGLNVRIATFSRGSAVDRERIAATLTQQQGGEQEALAIEADRDLAVEYITREMEAWTGSEEIRAARDAVNRLADLALRSKQPAASEGDVLRAVEDALQHWEARAKTCDDEAERFKATEPRLSRELSRDAGQYRSCIGGLRAALTNTSKQAAGEVAP